MSQAIVAKQAATSSDEGKESIARARARQLIAKMTLDQKLQQLTGSMPEMLPELPDCYGARHVSGIKALAIPTFRITNGPVGVGQNDCLSKSVKVAVDGGKEPPWRPYTDPTSAQATALPSAMAVAASFDPRVAAAFGGVIAKEMNNLALHVFEAPGMNLARLPIGGRNFEYYGEDPYLVGTMAVAEIKAVQSKGLIGMAKHFVANEQETNRMTIQETVDEQTLHELYLIPFEMSVKDGHVGAIMCSYNFLNGLQACDNKPMLTQVLRDDWKFSGYVQSDFFAIKTTEASLTAGTDHEMPTPLYWAPAKIRAALKAGSITQTKIDTALERRYTQMFKAGIFDRPLVQTPIDFVMDGKIAREIGARGAVLLQNNGALPIAVTAKTVVLIGKASQPYAQQAITGGSIWGKWIGAGGGSSDVVPHYAVSPIEGLRKGLPANATVKLVLVDDDNATATIDGKSVPFDQALATIAKADSIVIMAGTNSEEGADRATFTTADGNRLAAPASAGMSLDWYVAKPSKIATTDPADNQVKLSGTTAMIKAILATNSTTAAKMAQKTVLVLKDNASVAMDPALLGSQGPAIFEVWFPGQEDGNITADLLLGKVNPSGRLPVTFPIAGKTFLDSVTAQQYPGVPSGSKQTVTYSEKLAIGYRWYDANVSGSCTVAAASNPCVAFPFGYGLSYSRFTATKASLSPQGKSGGYRVSTTVKNSSQKAGVQVVQVYLSLPSSADALGSPQPPKRLVGFQNVELAPGVAKQVEITIDPVGSNHPLSVWNAATKAWVTPKGRFTVWVGTSASPGDLASAGTFQR